MGPMRLPSGSGTVPLAASWLGPLPLPGGAESPLALIRGLQRAPMSSAGCPLGCPQERRREELWLVWTSLPIHLPTKEVVRGVSRAAL